MFVSVPVESSVTVGTVVKWSSTNSRWESATSTSGEMIGIVKSAPNSENKARVQFSGVSWALCSRDIANEGGFLSVENGKVYVGSSNEYGVISPNSSEADSRTANSLVMVNLR